MAFFLILQLMLLRDAETSTRSIRLLVNASRSKSSDRRKSTLHTLDTSSCRSFRNVSFSDLSLDTKRHIIGFIGGTMRANFGSTNHENKKIVFKIRMKEIRSDYHEFIVRTNISINVIARSSKMIGAWNGSSICRFMHRYSLLTVTGHKKAHLIFKVCDVTLGDRSNIKYLIFEFQNGSLKQYFVTNPTDCSRIKLRKRIADEHAVHLMYRLYKYKPTYMMFDDHLKCHHMIRADALLSRVY